MISLYCNNCGVRIDTDFRQYKGRLCGRQCNLELEFKKTCSIMNWELDLEKMDEYVQSKMTTT